MNRNPSSQLFGRACLVLALTLGVVASSKAAEAPSFEGEKSTWHGDFDRYDYLIDEQTLLIEPFRRDPDEKFGVRPPPRGKRRCIVVAPKTPALGNPWSWRGCYWDHQPQTEVELLRRGFHIVYVSADQNLKPDRTWDAWYAFLTEKHGLSKKPAFIGMSRGGQYAYLWATANPDKVSCIYADNPGGGPEIFGKLTGLAAADVPILHVCGSIDPLLGRVSTPIETIYSQLGGRISVMIKEGAAHHPHSLRDATPIADFITQQVQQVAVVPPPFVTGRATHSTFYGRESDYRDFPKEGTHITCRGPWFRPNFDRYSFNLAGVEGAVDVIVPKTPASGKPWVFRADYTSRDSVVDLALLEEGVAIVTGPVPYNADGPSLKAWNTVYDLLVGHGLSKKPVMVGEGGAAGEAYAWAIANPDKVSRIYGDNPVLRCTMTQKQPLDDLTPLAKAGVPILHSCGALDPMLASQSREAERRYKELGGTMTVLVREGEGHRPTSAEHVKPVVDFILGR
ncbi:alpha/beta hydrolase [Paludisphaera rhizosphaerae]|uniref:alpha/beta hydrolase n=1 Tax=Paludisphaera rhizosphaerae TaxID=2711216 RepID=UPI00198211E4|nr:alpha/beta hydrolase [Paludisphaera rhizosphaerae]